MKNILIADDDQNLAMLYEQELTDAGYDVDVVHDARAAIERVAPKSQHAKKVRGLLAPGARARP